MVQGATGMQAPRHPPDPHVLLLIKKVEKRKNKKKDSDWQPGGRRIPARLSVLG